MRSGSHASNVDTFSSYFSSLRLLTVAVCLWPAIAGAQPPNPTASDANHNTAAGTDALLNVNSGSSNTAIGDSALKSITTSHSNTASGASALFSNTAGTENTASGASALVLNTTGVQNTASGAFALFFNTTGNFNAASGASALFSNTTGTANTANGVNALRSNTTGNANTANGVNALLFNTTGSNNTALGNEALKKNTDGSNNVAVGANALFNIQGTGNIAVGNNAGRNTLSGNGNVYIGHPGLNGSESKVTRIGNLQTQVFIRGIAGASLSGATVVVKSNGQLGVVASSARYKQNIHPFGDASSKLARLRPVSYRYKAEPQAMHYGLIAEEVDKVMPELVVRDEQNRPESVQYLEIIPLLLQESLDQQARIDKQDAELSRQRALIERLAMEVAELRSTRIAGNAALKN